MLPWPLALNIQKGKDNFIVFCNTLIDCLNHLREMFTFSAKTEEKRVKQLKIKILS